MDETLLRHYEQLKSIHERLEDILESFRRSHEEAGMVSLAVLGDDVRRMRDDAKEEYDEF